MPPTAIPTTASPAELNLVVEVFVFLLGACVGSFLNVVAYRLPLGKSLVHPPSACPRCGHRLAWFDNVPVLGWVMLGGKCRYCREPISWRYPVVELATAVLFGGYAVFFLAQAERDVTRDWPLLMVHLALLGMLMAASLIDLDTFTIPMSLCVFAGAVGLVGHGALVGREVPGNVCVSPTFALAGACAGLGWLLSVVLLRLGVMPMSFPKGEPMMLDLAEWEAEMAAAKAEGREPEVPAEPPVRWTRGMLSREMFKEMGFIVPILGGFVAGLILTTRTEVGAGWSGALAGMRWVPGVLGAVLGGLAGGGMVWFFRIGGTLGFGKLAMGLGDVHLMTAVGMVTGVMVAVAAPFVGAVWGLVFTVYAFATRSQREFPFGPYLALGTLTAMVGERWLWGYLGG